MLRFLKDQLAHGLAATTVNRRLTALHQFFKYLAGETPALDEWQLAWQVEEHRVYLPVVSR